MDNLDIYGTQIAFICAACMGGIAHYLKKVAKGETTATFTEWFGDKNTPATIYTLIVFFFVIVGSLAGDIINEQTGFWAALYTGFATGFAVDAGFNADGKSITNDIRDIRYSTGDLFGRKDIQRPYGGGGGGWRPRDSDFHGGGDGLPGGSGFPGMTEAGGDGDTTTVGAKVKVVIRRK